MSRERMVGPSASGGAPDAHLAPADGFRFEVIRRTDPRLARSRAVRAAEALKGAAARRLPASWRRKVKQILARAASPVALLGMIER